MKDGKEMAREMIDFVNQFSSEEHRVFVKEMLEAHLTLQQSFTRLCMMWFKALAEMPFIDDRNLASINLAKKIKKEFGEEDLPFI